jgi:hypothetical protein
MVFGTICKDCEVATDGEQEEDSQGEQEEESEEEEDEQLNLD